MSPDLPLYSDLTQLFLQERPLIDLRAPIEFSAGAFPTAISLPLMSDEERAAVGTCYTQQGQEAAIALGHKLVSGTLREARIEGWLAQIRQQPDLLIYCFRGGLRSQTVQAWLAERGVVVPRVAGGYKAMRQFLIHTLESIVARSPLWLITGMTGCGKTDLLQQLPAAVDLEHHARHRGSSFGALPEGQPSNIDFENGLAIELLQRQATGQSHFILEDESRMIGRCTLPSPLFSLMELAPLVQLDAPLDERIKRICRDYVEGMYQRFVALQATQARQAESAEERIHHFLHQGLERLTRRLGLLNYHKLKSQLDLALQQQFNQQDYSGHSLWIERLLVDYYDPIYLRHLRAREAKIVFRGDHAACRDYLNALSFQHLGHKR
ncbi:MAG: tRNA 2-selenouridine(34) synthase MnmH [Aeromonadaceae bacterium]